MREIQATEAKTHLARLPSAVERGESFDGLYLEVARRLGGTLASLDHALLRAARAEGLAVQG